MIFFSVIIPVFNRSHFLAQTIETVLVQSFPDFEIIIVDDGSTENIRQVIEDKFGNEKKSKIFSQTE